HSWSWPRQSVGPRVLAPAKLASRRRVPGVDAQGIAVRAARADHVMPQLERGPTQDEGVGVPGVAAYQGVGPDQGLGGALARQLDLDESHERFAMCGIGPQDAGVVRFGVAEASAGSSRIGLG